MEWLSDENSLFWIQGKPGSGKSTMVNHLAKSRLTQRYLRQGDNCEWNIIYYFFDFRGKREKTNNLQGLLRSLLHQIIKQPKNLNEQNEHEIRSQWHEAQLRASLVRALRSSPEQVCLFVDGLDEYEGDMFQLITFLKSLSNIKRELKSQLKICFSCRPEPIPSQFLGDLPGLSISDHNQAGIFQYVRETCKPLENDGITVEALIKASAVIPKRAEGVFLWAHFAINELVQGYCAGETLSELLERMNSLPQDLADIYERMVSRVDAKTRSEGLVMLQMVCAWKDGSPPLDQFLTAVDIAMGRHENFGTPVSICTRERFLKRLRAKGFGFLEAFQPQAHHRHFVKMIHRSVRNYLDKTGWQSLGVSPQRQAAQREILMIDVSGRYLVQLVGFNGSRHRNFDCYAFTNLMSHATTLEYDHKESSYEPLQKYLKDDLCHILRSQHTHASQCEGWSRSPRKMCSTGLALLYGLSLYYKEALINESNISSKSYGRFLDWAIMSAYTEVTLPAKLIPLVLDKARIDQHHARLALDVCVDLVLPNVVEALFKDDSTSTLEIVGELGHRVTIFWLYAHIPEGTYPGIRDTLTLIGERDNVLSGVFDLFEERALNRGKDVRRRRGPEGILLETLIHRGHNNMSYKDSNLFHDGQSNGLEILCIREEYCAVSIGLCAKKIL